jgi:hypothetical protein
MKPKYLLTYPDGNLMVKKALEGIEAGSFDRIIFTIVKEHNEQYEAALMLEQVFDIPHDHKYAICMLDDFTTSQAETVVKTIEKENIVGEIVIKDSDNYVKIDEVESCGDAIVGLNIETFAKEINRLPAKSFLKVNDQNIVIDIIEKRIKSEYICIGVYCFSEAKVFVDAYKEILRGNNVDREIYVSHVVSYLIGSNQCAFKYIEATDYEDWGTLDDWKIVQKKYRTYFLDLDGVLLNNRGKYGKLNWSNSMEPLQDNLSVMKRLYQEGAQIVITTSREEKYREAITEFLEENGIKPHAIVTGCNHSCRVVVNDFAPTNPYPSCEAINIKRNSNLGDYLKD